MMKRIWATVWATCMALTAALALAQTSEEIALAAYPSCTVKASASGNGFDAFALGNGEKTALCIVENGVLTVANERLFETGQGIQVFVDTDGESLFLDYDTEYARVSLHAVYRNGAWSDADVTCFEQNESGGVPTYPETHWYAEGGLLHVRYAVYDENENEQTGSRIEYEIPVGTDFDMSLGGIDMTRSRRGWPRRCWTKGIRCCKSACIRRTRCCCFKVRTAAGACASASATAGRTSGGTA